MKGKQTTMDLFAVSNSFARGDITYDHEVKNKKRINKFSLNAAKLSDYFIKTFQKNTFGYIDYSLLISEATEDLTPMFEKYNLANVDENSEQGRIKKILIENTVNNKVLELIKDLCIIKIPFSEFYDSRVINVEHNDGGVRFKNIYETIESAQNNSFIQYYRKEVREENNKLNVVNVLSRGALLPKIEIVVDEKIGGKEITNFKQLIEANVKNKQKYIKEVALYFDPHLAINFTKLYRNYTILNSSIRGCFKSIHSFKLDMIVRSIKSAQYNYVINKYDFPTLQKNFGVNYTRYDSFKNKVLKPALEDINNHSDDIFVELIEHRANNKTRGILEYVSFKITSLVDEDIDMSEDFSLEYYIANQHFYSNDRKINFEKFGLIMTILDYEKEIKKFIEIEDNKNRSFTGQDGDMTILDYEKEYIESKDCHNKLIMACQQDKEFFEKKGLFYDRTRLSFIKDNEIFVLMDVIYLDNPIKCWKYYNEQKNH